MHGLSTMNRLNEQEVDRLRQRGRCTPEAIPERGFVRGNFDHVAAQRAHNALDAALWYCLEVEKTVPSTDAPLLECLNASIKDALALAERLCDKGRNHYDEIDKG